MGKKNRRKPSTTTTNNGTSSSIMSSMRNSSPSTITAAVKERDEAVVTMAEKLNAALQCDDVLHNLSAFRDFKRDKKRFSMCFHSSLERENLMRVFHILRDNMQQMYVNLL